MDFQRPSIASPDAAVSKDQTSRLWQALPAEIRNMIFDCARTTIPPTSKEGVGSWARVAKEWRSVFLPVLWHTLTFQPSNPSADFRGFTEFVVKGQCRPLIKRVVLHVSLAPYECDECDQEECETTISSNNRAFADDVTAGFEHLSKWPAVESRTDRITLELRVDSPSDAQHMFATSGGRCARSEEAGYSETGAARRMLGYHLRRQSRDALGHFQNIWENPLHVLRLVGVVDRFSVNRSTLRIIDSRAMWTMLKAMPNLKSVNYEPWARPLSYEEVEHRNKTNADFFADLPSLARRGLRQVSFWEAYCPSSDWLDPRHLTFTYPATAMSRAASASFHATDFALSSGADPITFFSQLCDKAAAIPAQGSHGPVSEFMLPPLSPPGSEPAFEPLLERLALSICHTHYPDNWNHSKDPETLLMKAALAASYLPRLKIMELWAPGVGEGFIFRYHVKEEEVCITAAATWHIGKNQKVLDAWKKVAERQPGLAFRYDTEHIDPETLKEPESICKRLELYHLLREW